MFFKMVVEKSKKGFCECYTNGTFPKNAHLFGVVKSEWPSRLLK